MPALAGKRASIKIPGVAVAFTDEATTNLDNQSYQITNVVKQVWDSVAAFTVKVGGSVTGETYTLNRLSGTVKFATVNAGRAAVTISGSYLPLSTCAEAKSYSYALTAQNIADNQFGDDYVTRQNVSRDIAGNIGRWRIDTFFSAALLADTQLVLQFWSSTASATPDLTCWARLDRRGLALAARGLQEETIDFVGTIDADQNAIYTPDRAELDDLRSLFSDSDMLAIFSAAGGIT